MIQHITGEEMRKNGAERNGTKIIKVVAIAIYKVNICKSLFLLKKY